MLFIALDWRTYATAVVVWFARLDSNAKIIEVPCAHLLCDVCVCVLGICMHAL